MSKAFTCDVCGSVYDSGPANCTTHHIEFAAIYPQDSKRTNHTVSADVTVNINFPYGGDICSSCKRKALKMIALWLPNQANPLTPATHKVEAYKVSTSYVAYFRWWKWGRKGQSKVRSLG